MATGVSESSKCSAWCANAIFSDETIRHPNDPGPSRPDEPNPTEESTVELSAQALAEGDFEEGLRLALNSEGDSVAVSIAVDASIPTPTGASVGVNGKLTVQLQRTEGGGYEISLTTEQAISLGLEVSDELKVQAELEFETRAVYRFDTFEEATAGLQDLAVTAGGTSSGFSDCVSDLEKVGNVADNVANNPITDFLGGAADIVAPGTGWLIGSGQDLAEDFESATDTVNNFVSNAQDRLNDAFVSYEVSETVGSDLSVGLPENDIGPSLDLGFELSVDQKFTTRVNVDGSVTVSVTQTGTVSTELGGPASPSVRATGQASVTVSQDLVPTEDGLQTDGAPYCHTGAGCINQRDQWRISDNFCG